jgi:predicted Rossmann-fold nucleotide-binding protein
MVIGCCHYLHNGLYVCLRGAVMTIQELFNLLQTGGTPGIVAVCVYFLWKFDVRLARIEKAFEMIAQQFIENAKKDKT